MAEVGTILHFAKGDIPPINPRGFWSLTMYDSEYFLVANSANRYSLSSRDKFPSNLDGSMDSGHSEAVTRSRQASQLVTGPGWRFHSDAPALLAEDGSDQRRRGPAADEAGRIERGDEVLIIIRRLVREPLIHFAVLGAALFGLYGVIRPPASDASAIVVSSDRIAAIAAQFRGTWQRPPSRDELNALVESYVREEVFYREGRALVIDCDDLIVRNRVKQKMEVLSEDALLAEPSEADLQKYLDEHREVFATPAALSFERGGLRCGPPRRTPGARYPPVAGCAP